MLRVIENNQIFTNIKITEACAFHAPKYIFLLFCLNINQLYFIRVVMQYVFTKIMHKEKTSLNYSEGKRSKASIRVKRKKKRLIMKILQIY